MPNAIGLNVTIYPDGRVVEYLGSGRKRIVGTAVSLPDKHGRLIDADAFKETLEYYIREAGWDEKTNRVLGWVKDEFIDGERTVVESEGDN